MSSTAVSKISKAGVILSATVGVAFLALTGCASQQSGAATCCNLPCGNCKAISQCKGCCSCKSKCYNKCNPCGCNTGCCK